MKLGEWAVIWWPTSERRWMVKWKWPWPEDRPFVIFHSYIFGPLEVRRMVKRDG